jgi:hypothetical protein
MMKKLLIFMLVFGWASVASAHFIFTVDGEEQPAEITLDICEVIELDLELSADEYTSGYDLMYALSDTTAELITDGATWGPENGYPDLTDIEFPVVFDFKGKVVQQPDPQTVEIAAGQLMSDPVGGPGILMKELYLHCLGDGTVTLTITVAAYTDVGTDPYFPEVIPDGTLLHTLIIHQVPEPATIALLGLGGLLLRRRK